MGEEVSMSEITETTLKALELARCKYNSRKTAFGKYSSIFLAPTGNVKDMMSNFKNAKRVLAVGGAGAFGLEAVGNGATKVDMFDSNALQKHYAEMVKAAMTILDYEEFMKYFTLKSQGTFMSREALKDLVSEELFEKIMILLSYETQVLYNNLYARFDSVDLIYSKLYRFEYAITREYLKKFASMYDEERYYKIQKILRNKEAEITYTTADVRDLPTVFKGPYELIILGNIFQYYKDIPGLDTPWDVNNFIKNQLSNLLTDDGIIQVNYGFKTATFALKEYLNLRTGVNGSDSSAIRYEMRNGINVPLVRKWGYDYKFFPGVEFGGDDKTENMIITFKKG